MKYINITTTAAFFSFTNDLPEFNSIEFSTIGYNDTAKVSVKIGYKENNPAFDVDLARLKYIYRNCNITVTDEEENNTKDIPF